MVSNVILHNPQELKTSSLKYRNLVRKSGKLALIFGLKDYGMLNPKTPIYNVHTAWRHGVEWSQLSSLATESAKNMFYVNCDWIIKDNPKGQTKECFSHIGQYSNVLEFFFLCNQPWTDWSDAGRGLQWLVSIILKILNTYCHCKISYTYRKCTLFGPVNRNQKFDYPCIGGCTSNKIYYTHFSGNLRLLLQTLFL